MKVVYKVEFYTQDQNLWQTINVSVPPGKGSIQQAVKKAEKKKSLPNVQAGGCIRIAIYED